MSKRYRDWRPYDVTALAEWIETQLGEGDFDEAIKEQMRYDPSVFADVIEELIGKGEFDDTVRDRARALGMEAS